MTNFRASALVLFTVGVLGVPSAALASDHPSPTTVEVTTPPPQYQEPCKATQAVAKGARPMTPFRASVLVVLTAGVLGVPSAAPANDYTSPTTVVVTTPPSQYQERCKATQAPTVATGSAPLHETLPFTGGDVVGLALVGMVLLGAGTLLVRRNRANTATR